jgi:NADPH-dependent 2,4-dienoyl-CoA reductase/sulfur reductase-like enzyme
LNGIVVVGGGFAGHSCVLELRARGFDGPLTLVAAENHLPYDRTWLSKELLSQGPRFNLDLTTREHYEELGINLLLDTCATGVDFREKRLTLAGNRELRYSRLVICCGGRPTLPEPFACRGVMAIRELRDATALEKAFSSCQHLAIVGGGFIGGEVASSAVARGLQVTLIEALETPLAHVLGNEVGSRVAALHRAHGVHLVTGAFTQAIRKRGSDTEVELADGRRIVADLVLVSVGMTPAVGWLSGSQLTLENGVVTDSRCRSNVPDVFAAGDCARWWNPRFATTMRVEHWETAGRHGSASGASALGSNEPFTPVPFFWSYQHGVRFQWVGYAPSWDALDIDDVDPPKTFVARYFRERKLSAVFAAGLPRVVAAAREELEAQTLAAIG